MQLSQLAETLIGSEIVKLGGEIREKIRQGAKIYNFTVGDFDPAIFPIPKELEDGIVEAYRKHYTNYPAGEGNLDLRESISVFIKDRQGLVYAPDEILVASGGRPLIYSFFRTVVDRGDKVIYPVPSWNNNHYTHLNAGEHVVVEATAENNFMPTAEAIRPHIAGAALICLCSPQNPTGTTISRKDLSAICELVVEENARRGEKEKKLYILYDQMYWQLTYDDIVHYDPVSINPAMREYTIFIDAISKVFAATGVRIGWALGPATIMKRMNAIMSHIGSWAPMAEQKATAVFLRQKEAIDGYLAGFRAGLSERLHKIYDGLKGLKEEGFNVDVLAPEAGIYLTIKVDLVGKRVGGGVEAVIKDQQEVTAFLLNEAGLAVVPFSAFGAPKASPWYRLSVGTCRLEDIPEMLRKLKEAMKRLA
ncbi:MAG TPA: pyridoxal phosphate-dependent aminotransferase [Puia sp.]|jgi:aspartate aminotransferase|nr:pyridoxal phosphate-dependent aminotransferase [Puia sp.]